MFAPLYSYFLVVIEVSSGIDKESLQRMLPNTVWMFFVLFLGAMPEHFYKFIYCISGWPFARSG